MTAHALDPLLKPQSIALMGASAKQGSPGNELANMVMNSPYTGKVYPINPGYDSLLGKPCYPDLQSLPETVEHVVFAVANERLESALSDAIQHGARAGTIYGNCYLEKDTDPPLKQRIKKMANDAGFAICGGNGMGFYSVSHNLYAGIYPFPGSVPEGGITLIAQSGSAFSAFAHNGSRLRFNLCVSSGDEISTSVADYMSWSLQQPCTRVIGLFLESVRDPENFKSVLHDAARKRIPVVILKVGKSPLGAALAHTHTGAIAGNHAAYEALFRKFGVIEVDDLNEMAATLMMLQTDRQPGEGKLAAIHESGGFRELIADSAHDLGIDFAEIGEETKNIIQSNLEPGLVAENPLDAWGSKVNFEVRFCACLSALMKDENVSVGLFVTNFKDDYFLTEAFYRNIEIVSKETDKPIAMVNCYTDLANSSLCQRSSELGIPLIDGSREAMLAVRHLLKFRDFEFDSAKPDDRTTISDDVVQKWQRRLADSPGETLGEFDSLLLLSDFGIPVPKHQIVHNNAELIEAAAKIGYPVALKTATSGVHHKTESNGVVLNIEDETALLSSYTSLSSRLGPTVLVSAMIQPGTEVGLGVINDDNFGPFVMVAAGGILIEVMADRAVSLAPVSNSEADNMISSLQIEKLLLGVRGRTPGDRQALIDIVVALSNLAIELKDQISEIDINPVIVSASGAIAVDGLVLTCD